MNFRNTFEFMQEGGEGDLESQPNLNSSGQKKAAPQGSSLINQNSEAVNNIELEKLGNQGSKHLGDLKDEASKHASAIAGHGKEAVGAVHGSLQNNASEMVDLTKNAFGDMHGAAGNHAADIHNGANDLVHGVAGNAHKQTMELANMGQDHAAAVANHAAEKANALKNHANDLVNNTHAKLAGNANALKDGASNAFNNVGAGAQDQLNLVGAQGQGLMDDINGVGASAQAQLDALRDPNEVANNCFACAEDLGQDALEDKGMECKVFAFAGIVIKGEGMIGMFDYEAQLKRAKNLGHSFVEDAKNQANEGLEKAKGMGESFVDKAQDHAMAVADDAQDMAGDIAEDAQNRAQNIADQAQDLGSKVVSDAQNKASNVANKAQDFAGNVASEAQNKASAVANNAKDFASKTAGDAQNMAANQANKAKDFASKTADNAKNKWEGVAKNASNFASKTASNAQNAANSVAQKGQDYGKDMADSGQELAQNVQKDANSFAENGDVQVEGGAKENAQKGANQAKQGNKAMAGAKGLAQNAANYGKNKMMGASNLASGAANKANALGQKGMEGAKDLASHATNQMAGVGKDTMKGAGDLASGAVNDMAGLGKDTMHGAKDLAHGAMGDAANLGKNTMKGAGDLAHGAMNHAADLGKNTMKGANDLAAGAMNDMHDLAGGAMAGASGLAGNAADHAAEMGNAAMAKSAALANKSMARMGNMGADAIGDVRNLGANMAGDLTKSGAESFSDAKSLLIGGNDAWVRKMAKQVRQETINVRVNGTNQNLWELLQEATLWNSGASYKTVTEIRAMQAMEYGEEVVEEVVIVEEVVEVQAEGGGYNRQNSFDSEEFDVNPMGPQVIVVNDNIAPEGLKLYGDKMDAAFLKFFKLAQSIEEVWKFQRRLDNQIKVLHQVQATEDNRLSLIAIRNSDPRAPPEAAVRVYVKGKWEDLEDSVTGFLSAKGRVKDAETEQLDMPELPEDEEEEEAPQAEGGDDDQIISESDSEMEDPVEWSMFVENIEEYAMENKCQHTLVVCYKDMSLEEFDDIKENLTEDDFEQLLDELIAICVVGLEEAEDMMGQCFTGVNTCLEKLGVGGFKRVDPNSEEAKLRKAQQAILSDIWDLKNSKDASDCCSKCKPLCFKICKLNPYAKAPAMMHTSDGSEDHANWASVVMGSAILVLLCYLLGQNFQKIGTITNISQESFSTDGLPRMTLAPDGSDSSKYNYNYGVQDMIYNLSSNITLDEITYDIVDARLPLYEREVNDQNFAPRVQIQLIRDPLNVSGLPGQKDFCGCWFNCQGADLNRGKTNWTGVYEGRFYYGVTSVGSWATSKIVNDQYEIDLYRNYAKQGTIIAKLQSNNTLGFISTTNPSLLAGPATNFGVLYDSKVKQFFSTTFGKNDSTIAYYKMPEEEWAKKFVGEFQVSNDATDRKIITQQYGLVTIRDVKKKQNIAARLIGENQLRYDAPFDTQGLTYSPGSHKFNEVTVADQKVSGSLTREGDVVYDKIPILSGTSSNLLTPEGYRQLKTKPAGDRLVDAQKQYTQVWFTASNTLKKQNNIMCKNGNCEDFVGTKKSKWDNPDATIAYQFTINNTTPFNLNNELKTCILNFGYTGVVFYKSNKQIFYCKKQTKDQQGEKSLSSESLGCFKDSQGSPNTGRVFPNVLGKGQTVESCLEAAAKNGADVFALQAGDWCFYGNSNNFEYNKLGTSTGCKDGLGGSFANDVYKVTYHDSYYYPVLPDQSCTHTTGIESGNFVEYNLQEKSSVHTVRVLNRGDGFQDRAYGVEIYAGDYKCGTWPDGEDSWFQAECKGKETMTIKIVQPKATPLSICGIEAFGAPVTQPKIGLDPNKQAQSFEGAWKQQDLSLGKNYAIPQLVSNEKTQLPIGSQTVETCKAAAVKKGYNYFGTILLNNDNFCAIGNNPPYKRFGQFPTGGIQILQATYGIRNVIDKVKTAYESGTRKFTASSAVYGDPQPGVTKTLTIKYLHNDKMEQKNVVESQGAITLPDSTFTDIKPKVDTVILTQSMQDQIFALPQFKNKKLTKIFKGPSVGTTTDFHDAVDGKSPTVVFYQTQKGRVWGMYTEIVWAKAALTDTGSSRLFKFDENNDYKEEVKMKKGAEWNAGGAGNYFISTSGPGLFGTELQAKFSTNEWDVPAGTDTQTYLVGEATPAFKNMEVYQVQDLTVADVGGISYNVYKINYSPTSLPESFHLENGNIIYKGPIKDAWTNAQTSPNDYSTGKLSNLFDGQVKFKGDKGLYGGYTRWTNQDQLKGLEVCINLQRCTSISKIKTWQDKDREGIKDITFFFGNGKSMDQQLQQAIKFDAGGSVIPEEWSVPNYKTKYLKFKANSGWQESSGMFMQELGIDGTEAQGCDNPSIQTQYLDKAKGNQTYWKINTFFDDCLITDAFAGQKAEFKLVSQTGVDLSFQTEKISAYDGSTLLIDFTQFPCLQDTVKMQYLFTGLQDGKTQTLFSPPFTLNVIGCKPFDANPKKATTQYKGCFKDEAKDANALLDPKRAFQYGIKGNEPFTVESCKTEAVKRGFNVFGIQETNWCWFGCNSHYTKYGKSSDCKAKDKGGDMLNSVYKVTLPASKNPLYSLTKGCYEFNIKKDAATTTNANGVLANPDWATQTLEGCYTNKDVGPFSDEGIMGSGMGKGFDVKSCKAAAVNKGFNTFALQDGDYCLVGCNPDFTKYGKATTCTDGTGGDKAASVYKLSLPAPLDDRYRIIDGCYKKFVDNKTKPATPFLVNTTACKYGEEDQNKIGPMGTCLFQKFNPRLSPAPMLNSDGAMTCEGTAGFKVDFNDTLEIDYSKICDATSSSNVTATIRYRNKILNPAYKIGWVVPGNTTATSKDRIFVDQWVQLAKIDICRQQVNSINIDAYLTVNLIERPATQVEEGLIENGLMNKNMFVLFNYNKQEQEVKITNKPEGSKIKVDLRIQHSSYMKTTYVPQTVSFFFNEAGALIAVHTAAASAMLASLMGSFNNNEVKEQLIKELKEKHPNWTDEQIEEHITPEMLEKKVVDMKKQVSFRGISSNAKQLDEGQKDVSKLNKVMSDLEKSNGDLKDKLKQVQDEAAKQQKEIKDKLDQLRAENEALKRKAGGQ